MPTVVANSIPANTPVPIECRLAAPAPARDHQRRHAEDERERRHENRPEPLARRLDRRFPDAQSLIARSSLANSTIRIAFLAARPTTVISADLEVDVVRHARGARYRAARRARRTGQPSSTANGTDQLSYCAASTRNTITSPSTKTSAPARPTRAPGTTGPSTRCPALARELRLAPARRLAQHLARAVARLGRAGERAPT